MSQNGYRPPRDQAEKLERRLARYPEAIRMVDEGTARPKVVDAVRLLRAGLPGTEIAKAMGLSTSQAYQLLNDPTDERNRARKHKRHGICRDCGAKTFNGGAVDVPERCAECANTQNLERNALLAAMWEADVPTHEIAAELGMTANAVQSWVDRERQHHGMPLKLRRRRDRELWPYIERLWNLGKSGSEIAQALGTNPHDIWQMVKVMRQKGIDLPQRFRGREATATPEEVAELWNAGLDTEEIAERLGYASTAALQSRVKRLRQKGHDLTRRRPGRRVAA